MSPISLQDVSLREGIVFRTKVDPRGSMVRQIVASKEVGLSFDPESRLVVVENRLHKQHKLIPLANVAAMTPAPKAGEAPVTKFEKK